MKEQKKNLSDLKIDKSWTLFLDRDGVISRKLENDYIKNWNEFEFLPSVLKAISLLAEKFEKIIIVTNQRGIGRKLMKTDDLKFIHWQMVNAIEKTGGRIDAIYFCPHNLEDNCNCRKPKTGMALQAKERFPEIDFKKSIMIGDALMDMELGKQLGMTTVLISKAKVVDNKIVLLTDFIFESLFDFSQSI